jgi:hypothetical protein
MVDRVGVLSCKLSHRLCIIANSLSSVYSLIHSLDVYVRYKPTSYSAIKSGCRWSLRVGVESRESRIGRKQRDETFKTVQLKRVTSCLQSERVQMAHPLAGWLAVQVAQADLQFSRVAVDLLRRSPLHQLGPPRARTQTCSRMAMKMR